MRVYFDDDELFDIEVEVSFVLAEVAVARKVVR